MPNRFKFPLRYNDGRELCYFWLQFGMEVERLHPDGKHDLVSVRLRVQSYLRSEYDAIIDWPAGMLYFPDDETRTLFLLRWA